MEGCLAEEPVVETTALEYSKYYLITINMSRHLTICVYFIAVAKT